MKTINIDEIIFAENEGDGLQLTVLRPGNDRGYEKQIKIKFNLTDGEVEYLIERIAVMARKRKTNHQIKINGLATALKNAEVEYGKQ